MIYFVRHGQCEANQARIFAGSRIDSPLTPLGRQQAQAVGQKLVANMITIDHIVSSPLLRCRDTADIIARVIDFDIDKIKHDRRVQEYDCGALSGQPLHIVTADELRRVVGHEDVVAFQRRVSRAFEDVQSLLGNTLVVGHGGVGRIIDATKQKIDLLSFFEVQEHQNGVLAKLSLDGFIDSDIASPS